MILERGALLNNRYRIVEILGQGGMGSVYRAIDDNLGVEVAVKDNLFTTEEYARQFRREATILANLRHPNLPRVTDHFIINGQGQYLVMDYIEGEDLRQRMERVGLIPEDEAIVIGAAVCDALSYLGTRTPPIIHRDLKPGNVKITPQGQIFLVDFGLAKTLEGSQATTTGARAMTPGYSPPEQYGTARTDQRSDIFSLGATLYAALTGVTPEDALARAMDQAELTPIRKCNPKISKRLSNIIEKALGVRPDDRYQTADEFKQALLGVNNSIRRRDGDFSVSPPPIAVEEQAGASGDGAGVQLVMEKVARPEVKSPPLLPISTPIFEEEPRPKKSRPRKKQRRNTCLVYLAIFLAVIGLSAGFVYRFNPPIFSQVYLPTLDAFLSDDDINNSAAVTLYSATPTLTRTAAPTTQVVSVPLNPSATASLTPTLKPIPSLIPTITPTPPPTPMGGGAGQIAFASTMGGLPQIYVVNSDGSHRRQITSLPEGACQPDWSPDGKRLVFISPCKGNTDYYPGSAMYIINEDGKGLLPLPTLSGGDYDPKWSPDGGYIIFTSLRNSRRAQLYVLNLDDNSVRSLSDKYLSDYQGSWSPDGKEIVFVSARRGGQEIYVVDVDGKNPRPLAKFNNLLHTRPSFSPDGNSIVFTLNAAENSVPHVYIASLASDDYVDYRVSDAPMRDATYSPDGFWLAFEGWEMGGSHNLYVIAAGGAGLTQLTDDAMQDFDPVWKPVP